MGGVKMKVMSAAKSNLEIGGATGVSGLGGVTRRINRELFVLLGGPAAAVLQVAHPVVAQGVAGHSRFREDTMGRLRRTLEAVYTISFGTAEEIERVRQNVARAHRAVRGKGYSAFDPAAQRWVLATLIWCSNWLYERWGEKLSAAEREQILVENRAFAAAFGLSEEHVWGSWKEFAEYWEETIQGAELGSLELCGEVARAVLRPSSPWYLRWSSSILAALAGPFFPELLWQRLGLKRSSGERWVWGFLDWFVPRCWLRFPALLRFAPAYRKALQRVE
jgi:uncharacterized protein (DUF2236 family)